MLFPGYRHILPPPLGGRGRRPQAGRGGDFDVPPCAGRGRAPSPDPSPRGDSHHGPQYGPSRGILRVHQNRHGVQQSLNLADNQPGTHCTHVVSSRQWGRPPPRVSPPRCDSHHGPLSGSSPGTPSSPSRLRVRDRRSLLRILKLR